MEYHSHKCIATKMLIVGIVLILVRIYTQWDMWIVIAILILIKGLIMLFMPENCCKAKKK